VSRVAENLARVRERIVAVAGRAGRDPGDIRICVVTKYVDAAAVREAVEAGCHMLGENRVQEAERKIGEVTEPSISWHMIGHLQKNKARKAVGLFDVIQSVDSLALARRLSALGVERGKPVRVFVEVKTSGEEAKSGVPLTEAEDTVGEVRELPGLSLEGLMTMAPFTDDEARVRAAFGRLREIRDRAKPPGLALSMGMTGDFEVAIEEGSTLVRLGTAIFG